MCTHNNKSARQSNYFIFIGKETDQTPKMIVYLHTNTKMRLQTATLETWICVRLHNFSLYRVFAQLLKWNGNAQKHSTAAPAITTTITNKTAEAITTKKNGVLDAEQQAQKFITVSWKYYMVHIVAYIRMFYPMVRSQIENE